LIENAGLNSNEQLPNLLSRNVDSAKVGVDVFSGKFDENETLRVYDSLVCKMSALKLAAHAALTILRVDQIIVAKPAGGPKVRDNKGWDND
jgi:T-complex protein 1 subunit theta